MRLFAFILRRPRGMSLVAIGIVLFGFAAWRALPVGALPAVDLPTIQISAILPGADPDTMSRLVSGPLERRLGAIEGVTEITSTNVLGAARIFVQFDLDRKMDGAANDVQAALHAASKELPREMNPPEVLKLNPVAAPVVFIAVTSDTLPAGELDDVARRIVAQKLALVPGVGGAIIQGGQPRAIRIRADPRALASMNLGLEDVRGAVQAATVNRPKGTLRGVRNGFSITTNDQLHDSARYGDLVIASVGGTPVTLGQVASISDDVLDTRTGGWYNGRRAVFVFVQREAGANIVETARRVREAMAQMGPWLPGAVSLELVTDRSDSVDPMIIEARNSVLLSCVVIAGVIVLALRSVRLATIAALNIPISLLGTLGFMWLAGFTLDLMSIGGIAICVGLVVDDAIVVVENIAKFRNEGRSASRAALLGVTQVGLTIIAITLALVATLSPLLVTPGPIGVLVGEFAATICVAVVLSGLLSLTLTPALCAGLPPPKVRLAIGGGRILGAYAASLKWSLDRPILLATMTAGLCAVTIALYAFIPKGFLPVQDTGLIFAMINAREDISFTAMTGRLNAVTRVIATDPAVRGISAYLGSLDATGQSVGRVWISLKPLEERGVPVETVINRLRPALAGVAGAETLLQPIEDLKVGAREGSGRFQYTINAENWETLRDWLPRVMAVMNAQKSLTNVGTDQITNGLVTRLVIARDLAAKVGVSTAMIDQTLYDAFGQRQIALISRELDQIRVVLEIKGEDRADEAAIDQLFVPSANGDQVPLRSVTRRETVTAPVMITHQGQTPAATIFFDTIQGVSLGSAIQDIETAVTRLRMPDTLRLSFEGNARAFQASQLAQPWLFLMALAAVYIVLGVLYESYVHPLTILSTLPSTGLGALLGLMVFGMELSVVSFIGMLLLIGIAMKNAIILVDFAQYARRRGKINARDAMLQACLHRFRPILMTSITAILGALPLAFSSGLGASFRRPLGVAVVGGLMMAQFLTLYTTPIVYVMLDRLQWRRLQSDRE